MRYLHHLGKTVVEIDNIIDPTEVINDHLIGFLGHSLDLLGSDKNGNIGNSIQLSVFLVDNENGVDGDQAISEITNCEGDFVFQFTLGEFRTTIANMLVEQLNGSAGALLVNGYNNVFFVCDEEMTGIAKVIIYYEEIESLGKRWRFMIDEEFDSDIASMDAIFSRT